MNGLSRYFASTKTLPQRRHAYRHKIPATSAEQLKEAPSNTIYGTRMYGLLFSLLFSLCINLPASHANDPNHPNIPNPSSSLTSALTLTQPLAHIISFAEDDPVIINLDNHFDVSGKEQIEYEVTLNAFPEVAGTYIQDNLLTITLEKPGQTRIRITANHQGDEAELAFLVGVMPVIEGDYHLADLNQLDLNPESYWNGSDESGGFASDLVFFPNHFNPEWASWSGWAYSNKSDTTTAGWSNQYSAITGNAIEASDQEEQIYALSFVQAPGTVLKYNNPSAHEVKGLFVTNTTYTALSMKYGDDYAKKFGGPTGDDPDWFRLTVTGHRDGEETGAVEYHLADYRFENNDKNHVIKTWQWVELSSLGKVDSLMFNLNSSDVGDWGMNTPAYFAADHIYVVPDLPPIVSNPIEDIAAEINAEDLVLDISQVFTDPDDDDAAIQVTIQDNTNTDLVDASVNAHTLHLSFKPDQEGSAEITLKALSNGKSVTESFQVSVSEDSPNPYIYQVLEYTPAPGQFINKDPWGTPGAAQSIVGTINGSLSLGAFGGQVVFRFQEAVQNHPDNPFGVDFIIFGNPTPTWSEPATVWVMQDKNQNGQPDGTWYQLAGSDYHFSTTKHDYEVTYFNPGTDSATDVQWEDNYGNQGFIYANSTHTQPYYPDHELFPHIDPDQFTLSGTRIAGALDESNPAQVMSHPRAFGYADNTARNVEPIDLPDNPYTSETVNAGGDGFDISWAVDEEGNYVELDEIHFIKVQTAMVGHGGWLGEISAEITGALVVSPESDVSGPMDMVVVKDLPPDIHESPYPLEALAFHQGRPRADKGIAWDTSLEGAWVDSDDHLHFDTSGELTLTAYLDNDPEIYAEVTTILEAGTTLVTDLTKDALRVYPNPATDHLTIEADHGMHLRLFDVQGNLIREMPHPGGAHTYDVSHLQPGVYLLVGSFPEGRLQKRLLVQ